MRPANATVDDSEDGACPLFDHVLPANVRRTGYETPVQRVQAVESPEDKSHDKAVKIPDSIKDESPRERVVVGSQKPQTMLNVDADRASRYWKLVLPNTAHIQPLWSALMQLLEMPW